MDIGIVPLTGTTNEVHMKQDLQVLDLPPLPPDDIKKLNNSLESEDMILLIDEQNSPLNC
jgi:aryl-alcohol dehydrogenase-like predicted oxidoreductase